MKSHQMFTIYVCPECEAITTELTASQHGCKERCRMWVTTKVIELEAVQRLDRENYRLRWTLDAVLDRATRPDAQVETDTA